MNKTLVIAVLTMLSCKTQGGELTKANQAEGTYGAEILNCTNKSNSKLESKICECQVDIRWKVKTPNACDQAESMKGNK